MVTQGTFLFFFSTGLIFQPRLSLGSMHSNVLTGLLKSQTAENVEWSLVHINNTRKPQRAIHAGISICKHPSL